MTFRVTRASGMRGGFPEPVYETDRGDFVDIETIEELVSLREKLGTLIITQGNDPWNRKVLENVIEVYDAWIE